MIDNAKQLTPIDQVRGSMQAMESQFRAALPPQIPVERFTRVVMTALQGNPDLVRAERSTLFEACVKAATDGLLPDGKEGALVTYNNRVVWMPMVQGILKKVRNSGELSSLGSQVFFKNDKFRFWIDAGGDHLEHEPLLLGDRGDAMGVYAVARTKDGASYIEVMTKQQVYDVRNVSRARGGPWSGPFEHEMWRKTAIRRLAKRLPMSTDLEQVITREDENFDFSKRDTAKAQQLSQLLAPKAPTEIEVPSELPAIAVQEPGADG